MRENDYQKLMKQIHVSETLEEQVLTMARRQETRALRQKHVGKACERVSSPFRLVAKHGKKKPFSTVFPRSSRISDTM